MRRQRLEATVEVDVDAKMRSNMHRESAPSIARDISNRQGFKGWPDVVKGPPAAAAESRRLNLSIPQSLYEVCSFRAGFLQKCPFRPKAQCTDTILYQLISNILHISAYLVFSVTLAPVSAFIGSLSRHIKSLSL